MIIKFQSPTLGCWVYEDGVCQVKVGDCKFREKTEDEPESTAHEIPDGGGLKLVPAYGKKGDLSEALIDFDWIVDPPSPKARDGFKWITLRYGKEAGWHTEERTFIFRRDSHVFLLSNEGKTVDRM